MRILWLSGNPSLYTESKGYNGGGWISSLQHAIKSSRYASGLTLGIAFLWSDNFKDEEDDCIYYGIKNKRSLNNKKKEASVKDEISNVISDFMPDIIHVFGTETILGVVTEITEIPVVIHIQGMLNAYREAWMPQGLSWSTYFRWHPMEYIHKKLLDRNCGRELGMYHNCPHFMGRTVWDKGIVELLSPKAKYYYCSEMLRSVIYDSEKIWQRREHSKKKILSIISSPVYKGGDVILRVAKLLKKYVDFDFEWMVYGVSNLNDMQKLTGVEAANVNVYVRGIISADQLVDEMTDADVYVHPSYIENSPNTVCEAQVLGVPVIATHVGGVETLIHNNVDGLVVSANDVYTMAIQIKKIIMDSALAIQLGKNGRMEALQRHNPETIVNDLLACYRKMLEK